MASASTPDAAAAAPASAGGGVPAVPHAPGFHRLKVSQVRQLTDDAAEIVFEVPDELADEFTFAHGQHLTLRVPGHEEELRRTYSLTCAVGSRQLSIGVRRQPHGRASTWLTTEIGVGTQVDVMTPAGRFSAPVDPAAARHWLLIAAGSGITPIMSIIRTVLAHEPRSEVTLLYANRGVSSVMFLDELEDLKNEHMTRLSVHHFFTRERRGAGGLFDGRITAERLERFCRAMLPPERIDEAFVCGPEPMARELHDALVALGVDESHVHVELFGTGEGSPTVPRPRVDASAEAVATARVRLFGIETTVPLAEGEPVLDAAIRAGLDAPYACKAGVCSTCRAHLDEGEVTMHTNHALDAGEVAAGYILTCQSTPCTPTLVVDYDRP